MCHDNKEWSKIWREIDLPFQIWYEKFGKLTGALENLKNVLFNGLLLTKVYNASAKGSTEGLCLIALEIDGDKSQAEK